MKEVVLTKGKIALVSDEDFESVSQFTWSAFYSGYTWYARRSVYRPGRAPATMMLHCYLLPGAAKVDHKDGDGLNNQRPNLRPATDSQNMQNRRKHGRASSPFKGVSWNKSEQLWTARIMCSGTAKFLGYFPDELEAAHAYDSAARHYFGEFAKLNLS